jgi:hypothetical protein
MFRGKFEMPGCVTRSAPAFAGAHAKENDRPRLVLATITNPARQIE